MNILITKCCICHVVIGCYVENREPKKKHCHICTDDVCFKHAQGKVSHGYCQYHGNEMLQRIKNKYGGAT